MGPMRHAFFLASDLKCQANDTTFDDIQPCKKEQTFLLVLFTWLNIINCGVQ
jgi:hypothetical protein